MSYQPKHAQQPDRTLRARWMLVITAFVIIMIAFIYAISAWLVQLNRPVQHTPQIVHSVCLMPDFAKRFDERCDR